jgi:hypothetical protein
LARSRRRHRRVRNVPYQIKRVFHGGFLWQANYMWSHAITDSSSGAGESVGSERAFCRACDRSNAPDDIPQSFNTSLVYQLPFGPGQRFLPITGAGGKVVGGRELSAVGTARSGLPLNVTVTRKASVMPDGYASNQRPNLIPGVSPIPPGGQTINKWLNPAAFALPAPFTWGNLGRYIARGPHEWETELTLSKRTPINERFTLNFRAEAFNLLNHPNYGNPVTNFSSGAFGRITSSATLTLSWRIKTWPGPRSFSMLPNVRTTAHYTSFPSYRRKVNDAASWFSWLQGRGQLFNFHPNRRPLQQAGGSGGCGRTARPSGRPGCARSSRPCW